VDQRGHLYRFRPGPKNEEYFHNDLKEKTFSSKNLSGVHPETPSPLAGEGWGEGEEKKFLKFPLPITPTLTLPPQMGREIPVFPDRNQVLKKYHIIFSLKRKMGPIGKSGG